MADSRQTTSIMLIRLALVALVIAVYWPAIGFGYVRYDDPEYVTGTPQVQVGLTAENVQWALTTYRAANWHPLTWLSLMFDTSVFGNDARGHHLVNVILHGLNVLLLFGVLRMMTGALWCSAMVSALLAAHPLHVESVAWISERKDVLSMFFWLLAMRAYTGYARDRNLRDYLLVLLWMALGLMAKPMVITLPGALLLLDYWPLRRLAAKPFSADFWRGGLRLAIEKLPLVAMSIANTAVTFVAQRGRAYLPEGIWISVPVRLENVVISYALYLGKLFWPARLAAMYPNLTLLGKFTFPLWQVAAAGALLTLITTVALIYARRAPYVLFGWLWFLFTLTPVIGFVQVGRQLIADRYAYIPFIGLYIAIVWLVAAGLARWRTRRAAIERLTMATSGALIVALAFIAHRQVWVWQNSHTLFAHAVQVTDHNWLMLNNLAAVLEEDEHQLEQGLSYMQQAVDVCSECGWVLEHHGEMLARSGHLFEAQDALQRAIAADPRDPLGFANLGNVMVQRGQIASAIDYLRKAVELEPDKPEWRKSLASALSLNGRHDEAIAVIQEGIRLRPETSAQWQELLEAIEHVRNTSERR